MADVEDAAHLRVELRRIVEVGIVPVDGMAGGRVEAAFAHGIGSVLRAIAAFPAGCERERRQSVSIAAQRRST